MSVRSVATNGVGVGQRSRTLRGLFMPQPATTPASEDSRFTTAKSPCPARLSRLPGRIHRTRHAVQDIEPCPAWEGSADVGWPQFIAEFNIDVDGLEYDEEDDEWPACGASLYGG